MNWIMLAVAAALSIFTHAASAQQLEKAIFAGGCFWCVESDFDKVDPSRKSGGALHRLHCFCLEFDRAFEVQRRVPTDGIIEPIDVSGYGSFSLAS